MFIYVYIMYIYTNENMYTNGITCPCCLVNVRILELTIHNAMPDNICCAARNYATTPVNGVLTVHREHLL